MPWIENISLKDVQKAFHHDPGPNSLLIQIVDPGTPHPKARYPFKNTAKFSFLDIEEEDAFAIQKEDAVQIAKLLRDAYKNNQNVVVHCHAGICRSGAVVAAAEFIGFEPVHSNRIPNMRVKGKILAALSEYL